MLTCSTPGWLKGFGSARALVSVNVDRRLSSVYRVRADGNPGCTEASDTLSIREKAVSLGPQIIQLRPALHCRTLILSYSLDITPPDHLLIWQLDASSNQQAWVLLSEEGERIRCRSESHCGSILPQPFSISSWIPQSNSIHFNIRLDIAGDLYPSLLG